MSALGRGIHRPADNLVFRRYILQSDSLVTCDSSDVLDQEFINGIYQIRKDCNPVTLIRICEDHVILTTSACKYAKSLWNTLVMKCRKVAGLHAMLTQDFEKSTATFPFDYVESKSYTEWLSCHTDDVLEAKSKYPPSKWTVKRNMLETPLKEALFTSCLASPDSPHWVIRSKKILNVFLSLPRGEDTAASDLLTEYAGVRLDFEAAFVRIEIRLIGKGSLNRSTLIYTPEILVSRSSASVNRCLELALNCGKELNDLIRITDGSRACGYVTTGDVEIGSARCKGLALISCISLNRMIRNPVSVSGFSNLVVVKCPRTGKFALGTVKISTLLL